MKKGCFFVTIFLLTILIAAGIYLYRKYSYKLEDFGKEKIMEITLNKLNEKLEKLEKNNYRDSLKYVVNKKVHELKNQKFDIAMYQFQNMIDFIKIIIEDGKIDSLEFYNLKKIASKNERSKKDRN
ncbi:hypothetical protein [Rosettibacter firmus]|uniref:hypothetical protein n=1 Tax=Rosettibacter firmus TaxID=3111522 RepID=UPI00336BB163